MLTMQEEQEPETVRSADRKEGVLKTPVATNALQEIKYQHHAEKGQPTPTTAGRDKYPFRPRACIRAPPLPGTCSARMYLPNRPTDRPARATTNQKKKTISVSISVTS